MKWKQFLMVDEERELILAAHMWPCNDDGSEDKEHILTPDGMCWCAPPAGVLDGVPFYRHNPGQ